VRERVGEDQVEEGKGEIEEDEVSAVIIGSNRRCFSSTLN
jgi:hypothetical protein